MNRATPFEFAARIARGVPRTLPGLSAWIAAAALLVVTSGCGGSDEVVPTAPSTAAPEHVDTERGHVGPPNMLLYIVDTLRADALSSYGAAPDATPNIAAFAAESVVFERAYAQSSWTRASVASILTSLYPGVHGAEDRPDVLSDRVTLLSEIVRKHGYRTGFITTNPNTGRFFGFDQGFDELVEMYDHVPGSQIKPAAMKASAEDVAARVTHFLEAGPEPFLLVVLSIDPHSPYSPPTRFDRGAGEHESDAQGTGAWINRRDLRPSDKARIRSLYDGEVAYTDHGFGDVRKSLRRLGLDHRTITVLTSDHGEAFWEHGERGHGKSLYDETVRVPLLIHYPAKLARARRAEAAVETIDIAPTLLDLAGLPAAPTLAGRSLFADDGAQSARAISRLKLEEHDIVSLHKGNWKLIWDLGRNQKQLFDVRVPGEHEDIAAHAQARVEAMTSELETHLAKTHSARTELLGDATPSVVTPEDLPEEQRRLLEELGYLEPEREDTPQ